MFLQGEGNLDTTTQRGRTPWDTGGRDWSYASTSQEIPRISHKHWKQGRETK